MIQYFPTITGSLTVNGDLIVTGTGSMSASLALNSNLLQGTGSTGFATTASLTEVSSSQQQISASLLTLTASYAALSSSYTALSGSYTTFSGSASTRVTQIENTYATTGSNSFRADQSITGSLVVSSTITAQTLVVQTVTSSIVYSSGSNLFGNQLANTQTFTGSLNVTGSGPHTIFGNVVIGNTTSVNANAKLEVKGECFITPIGTTASKLHLYNNDSTNETYIYDSGSATNSMLVFSPGGFIKALMVSNSGNVCIGTSVAPAVNGLGLAIYASDYPRITLRNSTSGDTTGDGLQIAWLAQMYNMI